MKRFCQNGKVNINLIPSGRTVELQYKSGMKYVHKYWLSFLSFTPLSNYLLTVKSSLEISLLFFCHYISSLEEVQSFIQGISFWNGLYELALTDKNIQVRFGLKMIQVWWDREFLGTTTFFPKNSIGWHQQPLTERVSDISKILDFWWPIPQKGTSIG